ncbi:hypothetical protein PG988_003104 [Apiospora saccharicola]
MTSPTLSSNCFHCASVLSFPPIINIRRSAPNGSGSWPGWADSGKTVSPNSSRDVGPIASTMGRRIVRHLSS